MKKDEKNSKHARETYAPKNIAQALLITCLVVAITIMASILLHKNRFSKNFDLTANKINSLSNESTQFLNSLDTDVQIICIPGANITDTYCDANIDLLNLYSKTSSHIINLGVLDLRDRALLERVQPSGFSRLVLLSQTNKSEISGTITESKLTNAIVNLIKFKKTVYFLSGHGEPELTASNTEKNYSEVAALLEARAYEVKALSLTESGIPADVQLLIAGDNSIAYDSFTEAELIKFMARGGKLILIVNPYRTQGLAKLYQLLNLQPENILLVLNRDTALGKQLSKQNLLRPPTVLSDFNPDSPISNTIVQSYGAQANVPIDGAQPFRILQNASTPVKTNTTVMMSVIQAAPITLSDNERNKIKLDAPFTLSPDKTFDSDATWPVAFDVQIMNASALSADVAQPKKTEDDTTEAVIYGFSLVNEYSGQVPITVELIPITVAQLYRDKELISVPSKDYTPKPFNYSRNPSNWILPFTLFLPIFTAIAGLYIWIRRRRG